MHIEFVLKVDTIKITVQQRFIINKIVFMISILHYMSSGEKTPYFEAAKIILKS